MQMYCDYRTNLFISLTVSVQWKPYLLSVNTPPDGEDMFEHLAAKYGRQAAERFRLPGNPLDLAGEKVGISFSKTRRFVNTMDGHRLMEWCNTVQPDKSDALMEVLFHAYFEEGRDISKKAELVQAAQCVGLDVEAINAMLDSNQYRDTVLQFDNQVKNRKGVSGVPHFIIEDNNGGRPTAFSGAQVSFKQTLTLFLFVHVLKELNTQPPEVIAEVLEGVQGH